MNIMANDFEILNTLKKIQEQVNQIQKSNRLMSPEHIAQALAFKQIKDELTEMKKMLVVLTKNQP
ncbi:unannotated protein [freshwater metagenome]|uniref:Unannotated protein n=1 Tax=freshwater metagenome TaxID=449393 RepID=A0A6J6Z0Y9_9ZZZZ